MKKLALIFTFIFTVFSCGKDISTNNNYKVDLIKHTPNNIVTDPYINSFREIRNLIYKGDINNLKKYFKFPIRDENIWFLVDPDGNLDSSIPFNEKDFDKYFNKIFDSFFIKLLLKIKSEDLFLRGVYTTDIISYKEDGYMIKSRIIAKYTKNSSLSLSLYSDYYSDGEKVSERLCSYNFKAIDGNFVFENVVLAG